MKVSVDKSSGFCWGVIRTIDIAEGELASLDNHEQLYVLGDIIHNPMEIQRLEQKGLKTISHAELEGLDSGKVLIRAHGEPPSTYLRAAALGVQLIDATCPVVWKVQERIRKFYEKGYQVVIYGKIDHADRRGPDEDHHRDEERDRRPHHLGDRTLELHARQEQVQSDGRVQIADLEVEQEDHAEVIRVDVVRVRDAEDEIKVGDVANMAIGLNEVYVLQSSQNDCVRVAMRKDGTHGKPETFGEKLGGLPDGMAFDAEGFLIITLPIPFVAEVSVNTPPPIMILAAESEVDLS